jgi:uncharacterized protein
MSWLWVIPLGLLVGLALGSLGGGGSIMTVPALVYLLGLSPAAATTSSLIIVGLTALVGVVPHYRRGAVHLAGGVAFGAVGIVGSVLGSRLAAGVPAAVSLSAFAALMLVVAVLMGRRLTPTPARPATVGAAPASAVQPAAGGPIRPVPLVLAGSGIGFLTGFLGVGGGFAAVPALVLVLGLEMPSAVGTSLVVIAVNSATALASRIGGGLQVDWAVVGGFAAVAIAGSLLGARIAEKVSDRILTGAFVVMLVMVAGYVAVANVPQLLT